MFEIYNQKFDSFKAADQYVREHLVRFLGRSSFYSDFVFALVQRHPEIDLKAPKGILAFRVQRNLRNPKALELYLVRPDDSEIDISWRTAVRAKGSTHAQNLRRAMRFAVRKQIRDFTNKTKTLSCQRCGTKEDDGVYFHIDHENPTFHELAQSFLNEWRAPLPEKFVDVPEVNDAGFSTQDQAFELAWCLWHLNHAKLRKLCALCNLSI